MGLYISKLCVITRQYGNVLCEVPLAHGCTLHEWFTFLLLVLCRVILTLMKVWQLVGMIIELFHAKSTLLRFMLSPICSLLDHTCLVSTCSLDVRPSTCQILLTRPLSSVRLCKEPKRASCSHIFWGRQWGVVLCVIYTSPMVCSHFFPSTWMFFISPSFSYCSFWPNIFSCFSISSSPPPPLSFSSLSLSHFLLLSLPSPPFFSHLHPVHIYWLELGSLYYLLQCVYWLPLLWGCLSLKPLWYGVTNPATLPRLFKTDLPICECSDHVVTCMI